MQGLTNRLISDVSSTAAINTDPVCLEQVENFSIQASYDNTTPAAFTIATTAVKPVFVTATTHGLFTGNVIRVSTSGTLPAPLAIDVDYFIIRLGANTFQVATSAINAHATQPLTLTTQGAGNHTFTVTTPAVFTVPHTAVSIAAKTVTKTAHTLTTGMALQVTTSTTLPTGYVALTTYYVVRVDANTFQLSDTEEHALAGTDIVAPVTQGAGNHTFTVSTPLSTSAPHTAITVAAQTVTKVAHGLASGMEVQVTTSTTLPAGYSALTDYFISRVDADTFKLATSEAHALAGTGIVDPVDQGAGTHTFTVAAQTAVTAAHTDVTVGDTTLTKTAHGMLNGLVGQFTTTTTLPAGLATSTNYYVIPMTVNTFRVATSAANALAGTFVDVSTVGTGTHTFTATTLAISIQPQISNDPDTVGWVSYGSPTTATATGDTMYDIPTDYKWARLAVAMTSGQMTFKAMTAGQG